MLDYPLVLHHGAVTGVTAFRHELRVFENPGILINFGLFQGVEVFSCDFCNRGVPLW